ncbi:hypothetical protein T06_16938 [Trichinella sp. T6]|nr:hypothetical protein T06_16938 [Trichinella sp. T6]
MGGVDLTGMLISVYRIDQKCRKWHIFYWLDKMTLRQEYYNIHLWSDGYFAPLLSGAMVLLSTMKLLVKNGYLIRMCIDANKAFVGAM